MLLLKVEKEREGIWSKNIAPEENSYYWNGTPVVTVGDVYRGAKPVVVELFCGCGGTSLGFEMAGYHVAVGCDIHEPSIKTFKRNHPNSSTILGDIRKVTPNQIKELLGGRRVDVLIGGVPCQGFSLNNRKRHEGDSRNFLYKEFVRFVRELSPKAIVLENVAGMKSTGNFVEQIERELSSASGMYVKSRMLFAPDYGVPQARSRLLFVGVRDRHFSFSGVKKTHGEGTSRPYNTVFDAISDLPSLGSGEKKTRYSMPPKTEYQQHMRGNMGKNQLTNHRAPNHPPEVVARIGNTLPGMPMYPKFKQRIRLDWNILSPTQVSGGIRPQFQFGHPRDSRGLTIRERCRLQSFPDSFFVLGGLVQGRVQTGNAVPPLLAKAVALAIKEYL